jgi:hypothetical protein
MITAFVMGNGVSRAHISISQLRLVGTVYGCNALYRDGVPDVLVATDTAIARDIQDRGYARDHVFYTRRPLPDSGALTVPREYFGFSSGPIAVALAAQARHDPVYLLGFDMGPDAQGRFNNCYAGTEFYKPHDSEPTFVGNWVRQLRRVLADHAQQSFVRVCGVTTAAVPELESLHNLRHISRVEFDRSINIAEEPRS